jgi:uncharacterized RDD family membrane protein YckC
LVLTGEVLAGFKPEAVWPKMAAHFGMEPEKLEQLRAHAPRTIKQDDDQDKLKALQASFARIGVQTELYPSDGLPALYVRLENTTRGPIPRVMVEQRVKQGEWASSIRVAETGSTAWQRYQELGAAVPTLSARVSSNQPQNTPSVPASSPERPARKRNIAVDGPARTVSGAAQVPEPELEPGDVLPPGTAINAGFWRRVAAFVLDSLVLYVPLQLVNVVVMRIVATRIGTPPNSMQAPGVGVLAFPFLMFLIMLIAPWLYYAKMESSTWQATLGKRAMGIRVVDRYGYRIGFGCASGRYFGKIVSGLIFDVGFMMAGWTERKQALHDKMAGTLIVFNGVEPSRPLPTERPPMPWYGWVLNIVMFLLPIGGIFAAIALPAYQDALIRARVTQTVVIANAVQAEVDRQGCQVDDLPSSGPLIENFQVSSDAPGSCTIRLTFGQSVGVPAPLRSRQMEWTRSENGGWRCSSNLTARYLPPDCRWQR